MLGLSKHLTVLRWLLGWTQVMLMVLSVQVAAHDEASYIGNSAVLVEAGGAKVLFDPFFHNNFGIYRLAPPAVHQAVMTGTPPYDQIDAIVISHVHEDHFSAKDLDAYLARFPKTRVFAPAQAMAKLTETTRKNSKLHSFDMDFGAPPQTTQVDQIKVTATRIPHAGWPGRKDIQNMVFSVTLPNGKTTMHMGDADPDDDHYLPYKKHWQSLSVNMNFPPYWFFMSAEGRDILQHIIGAKQNMGVHVPTIVPNYLQQQGHPFFSTAEEKIPID